MADVFPPAKEDWWVMQNNELMCPKCHETRLMETVTDFRGIQAFCNVCSFHWYLVGKQRNWRD